MAKKRVHELAREFNLPSEEIRKRLEKAGIKLKAAASAVDEDLAAAAITGKPLPNGNAKKEPQRPARPPGMLRPLGTGEGPAKPSTPVNASARPPAPKPDPREEQRGSGRDGRGGAGPNDGPRQRPTRSSLQGERAPGNAGGVRRVVIDSQAARRGPGGPGGPGGGGPGPGPQRRPGRGGGRRRRRYFDEEPAPLNAGAADAASDVVKINSGSTVKDVAEYLGISSAEVIKKLMQMGEMATLTQTLSDEAIELLAGEFDKEVSIVHAADEVEEEP